MWRNIRDAGSIVSRNILLILKKIVIIMAILINGIMSVEALVGEVAQLVETTKEVITVFKVGRQDVHMWR